jgi:hypothetical protein
MAPELVALNAWLQHREAKGLVQTVKYRRGCVRKSGDKEWRDTQAPCQAAPLT